MARFKREKEENRGKVVSLRFSAVEYRILKGIAEANDWTIADLMREALDKWLKGQKRRKGDDR